MEVTSNADTTALKLPIDYLNEGGDWEEFPEKFLFLTDLGCAIGQEPSTHLRSVVGLVLPDRSFAAALATLGICLARSLQSVKGWEQHFAELQALPKGTEVLYRDKKGKQVVGVFDGIQEILGQKMAGVKLKKSETDRVRPEDSLRITIHSDRISEASDRLRTCKDKASPFLKRILAPADPAAYLRDSHLDAVIIGQTKPLEYQLTQAKFRVSGSGEQGTLSEVTRPKEFQGAGRTWRTRIFSTTNRHLYSEEMNPHVVLFDGSLAFHRWYSCFSSSHCLVFLSRTDTVFEEALERLYEMQMYSQDASRPILNVARLPAGVESSEFQMKAVPR